MTLSKLSVGRLAIGWAVLLIGAALVLPPIGSNVSAHPVVKGIIAVCCVTLIVATPIALTNYFSRAWRRLTTVSNRTAYFTWLALESLAALAFVAALIFLIFGFTVTRFR